MNLIPIRHTSPVGQIARFHPAAIAVFEAMEIEYACKGGRQLREAAVAAGADPDELLRAVETAARDAPSETEESLARLIERLVSEHHRPDLPNLRELTTRLGRMTIHPDAERIRRLLLAAHETLEAHMLREERELFPRIEELDLHPHLVRAGSVSRPLLVEFVEHERVNEYLSRARELAVRLRGTEADTELLDTIEQLIAKIQRHLHLENNVLIPRVLDLEHRLKADRQSGIRMH